MNNGDKLYKLLELDKESFKKLALGSEYDQEQIWGKIVYPIKDKQDIMRLLENEDIQSNILKKYKDTLNDIREGQFGFEYYENEMKKGYDDSVQRSLERELNNLRKLEKSCLNIIGFIEVKNS